MSKVLRAALGIVLGFGVALLAMMVTEFVAMGSRLQLSRNMVAAVGLLAWVVFSFWFVMRGD